MPTTVYKGNNRSNRFMRQLGIILFLAFLQITACTASPTSSTDIQVSILADGNETSVTIPAGGTIQQALDSAGLSIGALDRVEPPVYTVLVEDSQVQVIRVSEEFEIVEEVIPFERQILRNESLAKDSEIYLQIGKNGVQEITYRRVLEDGEVVDSGSIVKRVVVEEPTPEIVMIGVQAPFVPISIPGNLIYLRDGNVWLMEQSTGNRQAVVTTGDLDGRVLSLSSDGNWLLFTRRSDEESIINSLWAMDIGSENSEPIDLKVENIVHFADWIPGSNSKVVFSTVEPRTAAPGWQANNDLYALSFSSSGWTTNWKDKPILEPNPGGVYGWWGMSFAWDPEGSRLAYARPDSIGLLDFATGEQSTEMELVPLQTRGDWAWVPGLTWGPDGQVLYSVDHITPPGSVSPEESQVFDLTAVRLGSNQPMHLVSQAGMFAYPITSPARTEASGESAYQVAFLQALFPSQSETSRYQIAVMDRDGSNRRVLYPNEEHSGGVQPQKEWGSWSPEPLPEGGSYALAAIIEGNLWIIDASTGQTHQITGDGLTNRVIWN